MSYRNRTLSEKKRIYKKLGLVITAILVVCIALAIALRPTKGNASHNASGTQAVEGMIEVDGVKYVPKKNIETYLFMGIDNMGKVQKVTDYEGAGRCDVDRPYSSPYTRRILRFTFWIPMEVWRPVFFGSLLSSPSNIAWIRSSSSSVIFLPVLRTFK